MSIDPMSQNSNEIKHKNINNELWILTLNTKYYYSCVTLEWGHYGNEVNLIVFFVIENNDLGPSKTLHRVKWNIVIVINIQAGFLKVIILPQVPAFT